MLRAFCVFVASIAASSCSLDKGYQVSVPATHIRTINGSDYGIRNESFSVVHDDKRHVTCWIFWPGTGAAMSCIPDKQIEVTP